MEVGSFVHTKPIYSFASGGKGALQKSEIMRNTDL